MKTYYQIFNITNGLDFLINNNWTGEQAHAAVQLLDDLQDQILSQYWPSINEYLVDNPNVDTYFAVDRDEDFDGDDGLPF